MPFIIPRDDWQKSSFCFDKFTFDCHEIFINCAEAPDKESDPHKFRLSLNVFLPLLSSHLMYCVAFVISCPLFLSNFFFIGLSAQKNFPLFPIYIPTETGWVTQKIRWHGDESEWPCCRATNFHGIVIYIHFKDEKGVGFLMDGERKRKNRGGKCCLNRDIFFRNNCLIYEWIFWEFNWKNLNVNFVHFLMDIRTKLYFLSCGDAFQFFQNSFFFFEKSRRF